MPTISRAKRAKARTKRNLSTAKRLLRQVATEANKNFSTVIMLLAQQGGDVTISTEVVRGTIDKLAQSNYSIQNTPEGVRVWIVTKDETATPVEAVTLTDEQLALLKQRMDARHNVPTVEASALTAELTAQGDPADADYQELREVTEAISDAFDPTPVNPTVEAVDPA